MKKIVLVSLLFLTSVTFAADGWKRSGKISAVQPEFYRTSEVGGGSLILIYTNILSTDCGGNTWVLRADLDKNNAVFSSVLTAFAADKSVDLYQFSCHILDGKAYPRMGGIKIIK